MTAARHTMTHPSLWGSRGDQLALFAPAVDARRVRRATDAATVAGVGASMALLCLVAIPPSGFEKALIDLLDEVPSFLDIVWRVGCGLLVCWVVVITIATLARRRFSVAADILGSLVVAALIGIVIAHQLNGDWPSVSEVFTGGSSALVPAVALGAGAAICVAAGPQLTRPFRLLGASILGYAAVSMTLLGSTTPVGAAIGWCIGITAAAVVHLVAGTEAGHAGDAEIQRALEDLGVTVHELRPGTRQVAGVYSVDAVGEDGRPLIVRVYGRDARDTQIVAKIWRSLVYRDATAPTFTRLQQVEHEAFVTLMAANRGLQVPQVVTAGVTSGGDALMVLSTVGTTMSAPAPAPAPDGTGDGGATGDGSADAAEAVEPEIATAVAGLPAVVPTSPTLPEVDSDPAADVQLHQIWELVGSLHSIGLVLGQVEVESFALAPDGSVQFADLRHAQVAPSADQRTTDQAQTLVVTSVLHGAERGVVAASAALGPEGLGNLLAYLQPAALTRGLRRDLKKAAGADVDRLRTLTAAAAGVAPPKLARLRRVSSATLFRVGLLSLIAFAIISTISGIGLDQLQEELTGAVWGWAVAAVVVGQLPFFTQAIAARGACPRPVAYGPLAVLQFAIGFINLAIPSSAARIALDVRFFQRQGVPAAAAVSIAAIDGFSGFLVQIALLLATLVFGVGQVELSVSMPSSSGGDSNGLLWIVGACVVLFVVAVILAVVVPKIRHRIVSRVKPLLGQVSDTVRSLKSPIKLLQLFGGCLANQVLFGLTLGACLYAFGGRLNLGTLIVVYVAAALFGGMMPVPGGIGVMEAALIAGLVAAGISESTASATALTFRLVTFYLPPVWGWFAFNWLQRKSYL